MRVLGVLLICLLGAVIAKHIRDDVSLRSLLARALERRGGGEDLGEPAPAEDGPPPPPKKRDNDDDSGLNRHARGGAKKASRRPPSCTSVYASLPWPSTMCAYDDAPRARDFGLSAADRSLVLSLHNELRRDVRPSAADMQTMYWDDDIAVIAQKWAQTCRPAHDEGWNRRVPGWHIVIGQNWAGGFPTWRDAIMAWHEEVKDFTYGASNDLMKVGHYTQIEQALAGRVGCGYAYCPDSPMPQNYVCNYAHGQTDINKPYASGAQCAACPRSCRDGLCDCGGKVCLNGGTLDVNTCTCQCTDKAEGDTCQKLKCSGQDDYYCGTAPYDKTACVKFASFPTMCPILCEVCKNNCPHIPPDYCQNDGVLGADCKCTCTEGFAGDKCDKFASCKADEDYCGQPYPYGYPKEYCTKYANIPQECPHMCGMC